MPLTVLVFSQVKASKIVFWNASLIPIPLSLMRNSKLASVGTGDGFSMTRKLIVPPAGVNLIALDRMFRST